MSPAAQRITVENRQRARFAKVPHSLIDDPDADRPAVLLYVALARIANFTRGASFDTSTTTIMRLARMARRDTFYMARQWLADHGYLEMEEKPNAPWVYAVCDGPDDPLPDANRDRRLEQNATGGERETRTPLARNAHTEPADTVYREVRETLETTPPTPAAPVPLFPELPAAPDRHPIDVVFDAWKQATGRNGRTVLDTKRRRLITRALDAYPVDDVLDAVRGWEHSAFHRGHNDRRRPYHDLDLLLRNAEHIERFRDLARGPREPDPAPRARQAVTTDRTVKTGRIHAP